MDFELHGRKGRYWLLDILGFRVVGLLEHGLRIVGFWMSLGFWRHYYCNTVGLSSLIYQEDLHSIFREKLLLQRSSIYNHITTKLPNFGATEMYTLKKSLGQHFLHDENMCKKIVDAIEFKPGMQLMEVGPGGGALTKYLLERTDITYNAVEVDHEKVVYLENTYPAIRGKIIEADILKVANPFEGMFNVVGNFPYNISSPIMFRVLEWEPNVHEVIGMFQKEVAQRIAAGPGSKMYGILSVLLQAYFKVEYLFDVPPGCFTPPPKVMSGVVKFTNIKNPFDIQDKKTFTRLVKAAFNQRRKTLRNALRGTLMPDALQDELMEKRAEQLSVDQFAGLYKKYMI